MPGLLDSTPKLPTTGTEVTLTLLRAGKPVSESQVQWENGNVSEVAQQYRDKLMGRKRDRTDMKVTGYDCSCSFLVADLSIIDALQAIQAQVETYQKIDDLSVSFLWTMRDGSFDGFVLTSCTAKFTLNMGGKDERNKVSLSIEAEDWQPSS